MLGSVRKLGGGSNLVFYEQFPISTDSLMKCAGQFRLVHLEATTSKVLPQLILFEYKLFWNRV